ncbi:putative spermidine/putrescine transport system permease protein [Bosea sp. OK403]|nr:putative spermidine/putrescine transport system permease protein [Bosea sp. OK403]
MAIFLAPLWSVLRQSLFDPNFTLNGYSEIIESHLFIKILYNTLQISLTAAFVTLIVGYPIAYHLSRQSPRRRALLLILVMLPFWTSILVKSYAFMVILGQDGIINTVLYSVGLPKIQLLYNRTGVIIGTVHFLVPFVLFPIMTSLLGQNPDLARAAQIMGASRLRIFLRITLPLSLPGVAAGGLLALVQTFGFFITTALLGGRGDLMMANLIDLYTREILNWNLASAVAVTLLALSGGIIFALGRVRGGMSAFGQAA